MMCMDFTRPTEQVTTLSKYADAFHLDVMDGHFAPNLALSPDFIKAIAPFSSIPLEAHLMTEQPDRWLEPLAEAGVSIVSPHVETINRDGFRIANSVASLHLELGLAINPMTPISAARFLLPRVSLLTLMAVDVGFSRQPFIPEILPKLAEAAKLREQEGLKYLIQIDGCCNKSTFKSLRDAGADMFVMGNSGFFGQSPDLADAWKLMQQDYESATGERLGRTDG